MIAQVDVGSGKQSVAAMIRGLGKIRAPVELVMDGVVVAKLIPPTELSEREKQQVMEQGWKVVEKARARTKGASASVIQKEVKRAVREVRAEHAHRRH